MPYRRLRPLVAPAGRAGRRPRGHRRVGRASLRTRWPCRRRHRPHGSWSFCHRASGRSPAHPPPFSTCGRTVCLGGRGSDGLKVLIGRHRAQGFKELLPDLAPRPSVPAIVDGGIGAVDRRAVAPAAARTQNVNNARDYPTVINPPSARLVPWKAGLYRRPLLVAQPELVGHIMPSFVRRKSYSNA